MTLRWKEFEKSAKRLARAEVERSPALKKQMRQGKASRNYRLGPVVYLLFIAGVLMGPAINWASAGVDGTLGALAVSLTGAVFLLVAIGRNTLLLSDKFKVLAFYPARPDEIFRLLFRETVWFSIGMFVAFLAAYFGLVFIREIFTLKEAVLIATGQAVLATAFAVHLFAFRPQGPWGRLGFVGTVGWAVATNYFPSYFSWEHFPVRLAQALPPAWIHAIYLAATGRADWLNYLCLGPIFFIIATAPRSFRRMQAYVIGMYDFKFIAQHQLESDAPDAPSSVMGPSELEEEALSGNLFFAPAPRRPGFIERLAPRVLSARQKLIAEFLWMSTVNWTAKWKRLGIALALIAPAVIYINDASWDMNASFFIALMLTISAFPVFAIPRGLTAWPAGSNLICPMSAGFPISYGDIYWTILKVNLLRIGISAPLWIAFAGGTAWKVAGSPGIGFVFALKFLFLLAAFQPIIVSCWMSTCTHPRRSFSSFLSLMAALALFGTMIPLLFLGFSQPDRVASAALVGMAAFALAWQRFHRWMYRAGRFDLVMRLGR